MRWLRRGALVVGILVLAVVAYAGVVAVQSRRPVALPEVGDGSAVGRREVTWLDASRHRRLSVWLWYPAARGTGHPASYAPGAWDALHLPGPVGLAETSFARVRVRAREGARPAGGAHGLVVLAPGLGLAAAQYQSLAESLAMHGYVVAGFTPTHSANVTVLDGHVVGQSPEATLPDASLYRPAVHAAALRLLGTWVADARFVARRTRTALPGVGGGTLYVGHSFGGATALEACHEDPSCTGAANLDGLDLGDVTHAGLDVPLLLVGHDGSCTTGVCDPGSADDRKDRQVARQMVAAGSARAWSVELVGTKHFDFTDYAAYRLAAPLRLLLPLGGGSGPGHLLDTERCVLDLTEVSVGRPPRHGCLDRPRAPLRVRAWPAG